MEHPIKCVSGQFLSPHPKAESKQMVSKGVWWWVSNNMKTHIQTSEHDNEICKNEWVHESRNLSYEWFKTRRYENEILDFVRINEFMNVKTGVTPCFKRKNMKMDFQFFLIMNEFMKVKKAKINK